MWGIAEQAQQRWEKQLDTVTKWDSFNELSCMFLPKDKKELYTLE